MRIAIVNDMRLATETLRTIVQSRSDLVVAWTAADGNEAIQRCAADPPDLVLMDMVMPVMDGVEATRRIMKECPCPILVVTATVEGNAGRVFEALGHGALDAVATPRLGVSGELTGAAELLRKIEHVRLLRGSREPVGSAARPESSPATLERSPLLAIAASTGGPQALSAVLSALPRPFTAPTVLVQHLGADFVPGFAQWLGQQTGLEMRLVERPEPLRAGVVYLAGRESHLVVRGDRSVALEDEPREHLHRPSADVLFESLARSGSVGVAALLTGMGRDGAQGLLSLRQAGWWTIAQDRPSSIVWGMPGEAVRIDAACATLPLDGIGRAIGFAFAREAWRTVRRSEKR